MAHTGHQPTPPAAGTSRRLACFGSVEAFGRGRVEVVGVGQDSASCIARLEVFDQRHGETGRAIYPVLDNGPCHTSQFSHAALAERSASLQVIWLARYRPQHKPREREWRRLQQDCCSHLARSPRAFVDEMLAGKQQLGGLRVDIVEQVPRWLLDGYKRKPAGRPTGRPKGAYDAYPRPKTATNLPVPL